MPGETIDEIRKTINFAKELNPTYLTFGIFTPLPGSELFDEVRAEGTLLSLDYGSYFNKSERILGNQLDLNILKRLLKEAYKKTYFNPRFFIHRLTHLMKNPSPYEVRSLFEGFSVLVKKQT